MKIRGFKNLASLWLRLALILSILAGPALSTSEAQCNGCPKIFAPVKYSQREQLFKRLKLVIEYESDRQWDKRYETLPKTHTRHARTKEEYLAAVGGNAQPMILDFIAAYTVANPTIDGDYAIYGCAKVRDKEQTESWQAVIYASLEEGEWYLSEIHFGFKDKAPAPCTPEQNLKKAH
jgi:hypothetical protein